MRDAMIGIYNRPCFCSGTSERVQNEWMAPRIFPQVKFKCPKYTNSSLNTGCNFNKPMLSSTGQRHQEYFPRLRLHNSKIRIQLPKKNRDVLTKVHQWARNYNDTFTFHAICQCWQGVAYQGNSYVNQYRQKNIIKRPSKFTTLTKRKIKTAILF